MSSSNESIPENVIFACPNNDDESNLVDSFAIAIGVLTLIGSVIAYFMQQERERKDALAAEEKEERDLDRAQALERVREQLRVFIGPLHRGFKIQGAMNSQYTIESGHGFDHVPEIWAKKGQALWTKMFLDDFLQPFIDNPHSFEAEMYRNYISRRLKPVYTRNRELILNHMGDLADLPTQAEWLERWEEADVTSPYNGSLNINVIFDTFVVATYEYDDIIQSWQEGDFRRMQPTTRFSYVHCNDLVDLLYDKAKEKEAKYNKHVSVHKNELAEKTQQKWMETFTSLGSGAFANRGVGIPRRASILKRRASTVIKEQDESTE